MNGKDNEHVKLFESNGDNIKEVYGPYFRRMVGKKSSPALGSFRIGRISKSTNDSKDRTFGNSNSKLEQFVANSLRAPEFVIRCNLKDQLPDILCHPDCSFSFHSGKCFPDDFVQVPLPTDHGIRFY